MSARCVRVAACCANCTSCKILCRNQCAVVVAEHSVGHVSAGFCLLGLVFYVQPRMGPCGSLLYVEFMSLCLDELKLF